MFTCKFSPDGQSIASGSHDKHIFLWRVYGEECENYMLLKGELQSILCCIPLTVLRRTNSQKLSSPRSEG